MASFRTLNSTFNELLQEHSQTETSMFSAAEQAVEQDYAEALILGCGMEYGFYKKLQKQFQVPVIDPVIASFKACENLAQMKK